MISKVSDIIELDDNCIKSAMAYINPNMLSNILEIIEDENIKDKIMKNLSDETRKKLQLHNRSFDDSIDNKELEKNFLTIINRVLNFR